MKRWNLAVCAVPGLFFLIGCGALNLQRSNVAPDRDLAEADSENTLTLYAMPPKPVSLSWQTPKKLLMTSLKGMLLNHSHPIGHVNVEINCDPKNLVEKRIHILTGATSLRSGFSRDLLMKDKIGFGILTRAWPGRLESTEEIEKILKHKSEFFDNISAVTFDLSREACHRIAEYYAVYASDTKPKYYGFPARPRHLEGGGCSAFGASFVEVAGVLSPEIKSAWSQMVRIPRSVIADPLQGEAISVASLLRHPLSLRWAEENEEHVKLEFYDPELMHNWITSLWNNPEGMAVRDDALLDRFQKKYGGVELIHKNRSDFGNEPRPRRFRAIRIDRKLAPLPTDPILEGEPDAKRLPPYLLLSSP